MNFVKEEWTKILSHKMTFAEIMGFENVEQRRVAASYAGDLDRLLREADALLLDESERAGSLYLAVLLAMGFPQFVAYYLKYMCPSTGRIYISGIAPEIVEPHISTRWPPRVRKARWRVREGELAERAMAWKLGLTVAEYFSITAEA